MAEGSELWAVTAYFNPCHYRRRLTNYRVFRERLGIPLVAVEYSVDGEFELGPGDAERLVRIRGDALLWQKECLLNRGFADVPARCDRIAWLDCDVVFERDDWHHEAAERLGQSSMLQLFDRSWDMSREAPSHAPSREDAMASGASLSAFLHRARGRGVGFDGEGETRVFRRRRRIRPRHDRDRNPGLAWAARREILERHGLYDACILGSGDRAIACAAYDHHAVADQAWIRTPRQRWHYLRWARPFADDVVSRVGPLGGDVFHLWHGAFTDRRWRERHEMLDRFAFDPFRDIARGRNGCWRWSSPKPALHDKVRRYFAQRNEDGTGLPAAPGTTGPGKAVVGSPSAVAGALP